MTSPEPLPAYASTAEQAARIRAQITAMVAGWGPMPPHLVLRTVQLLRPHIAADIAPRRKAS
jgi:hypothetical protein